MGKDIKDLLFLGLVFLAGAMYALVLHAIMNKDLLCFEDGKRKEASYVFDGN